MEQLGDAHGARRTSLHTNIEKARSLLPLHFVEVCAVGRRKERVVVSAPTTDNHMKPWIHSIVSATVLSFAYGCSSAPTAAPKSSPTSVASIPSKPKVEAATASTSPSPSTGKTEAKMAPEQSPTTETASQGDGLRKASRPPVQLLTNSNALYMFNFGESEVGKTAKEQCETDTADRSEVSACLQKARAKVPVESVRFVKKGDEYFWITFNRYKGNLLKWHIIQFQVGEGKSDWVALKPLGKDKGIAPLARVPRTLEIELPNDFSIVLNDPELGKLTFDAKIGMMDD